MIGHPVLWLVTGTTGEYSDRSEWPVAAFDAEDDAKSFVNFLDEKQRELSAALGMTSPGYQEWDKRQSREEAMRAFDPNYSTDYTGTSWSVGPVAYARTFASISAISLATEGRDAAEGKTS